MSLSTILGALDAQVTPSTEPLLPDNNIIYAICGRKGSGKSTLLLSLLNSKRAFKQRFQHIFMVSPTSRGDKKFSKLVKELDEDGKYFDQYTEQVLTGIFNQIKQFNDQHEARKKKRKREIRHLLILDDCASDLSPAKGAMLSRMIITSRHLHCSVILTSQKYNAIPTLIRAQLDLLSVFKSYNTREVTTLMEDISMNPATFMEIYNFATDGDHSFLHMNLLTNPITFYKKFDRLEVDLDDLARTK
jgi:ABC-type dipeptide/oligopeptide/nickel transport system ATPase component